MRWSPASCERASRCLSGINQAGQRNLNLERVVSTNISPSGYIKPKFVVLSSFNISCCQERVSGTKLETTYHHLKTLRNRQILLKNESIDGFDSIVALLSEHLVRMLGRLFIKKIVPQIGSVYNDALKVSANVSSCWKGTKMLIVPRLIHKMQSPKTVISQFKNAVM